MISAILSILTGGGFKTIQTIATEMQETKRAIALAENDADKIEMEEKSKILQKQLDSKVRAQETFGAAAIMRIFFALPFGLYIWKIIVIDKIIYAGALATDPLGPNESQLMTVVISFYFLSEAGIQFLRRRG